MVIKNRKACSGRTVVPFLMVTLWLTGVGSAMGVVYSTYESRKATQELEELRREASGLKVVSGQYLLERSSFSAYSRIEKVAMGELEMVIPEIDNTVLIFK
ncbi:MAG: cell division protein FtsL [Agarilytica sp.]